MKQVSVLMEGFDRPDVITAEPEFYLQVIESTFDIKIYAFRTKKFVGMNAVIDRHLIASFRRSKVLFWSRTK